MKFQGNQFVSSKFIQFKRGMSKVTKGYVQIASLAVLTYVIALLGAVYLRTPVYADQMVIDKSDKVFQAKIESLKDQVVDELGTQCETKGYKDNAGVIIFDTNKIASIGKFQLQVKTVQYYEKLLYNRVISGQEAIEIAIDPLKAHDLVKDVLFKTKNAAGKDWSICSDRLGTDTKIGMIKQLQK